MRNIHLYLLLCVTVFFATGCPKYKPSVDFKNPKSLTTKLNTYMKGKQEEDRRALGSTPDGPAKAKTMRNWVIEDLLPYIDDAYADFITDIQAGRDRANFAPDVVELGTPAPIGIA